MLVPKLAEAEPDTGREEEDQHLQIEEERGPRGRLMLRYGGDDGNCARSIMLVQVKDAL